MSDDNGYDLSWKRAHPGEISESSKAQYRHRVALLRRRFTKEYGYELNMEEFVNRLIAIKPTLAMRSWRFYKAATMFVLQENAGVNYEAIELLAKDSSRGMPKESAKGSGKKLKKIPIDVANKLVFMLKTADPIAGKTRKYSNEACLFLLSTIETGLRPSEWANAQIKVNDKGNTVLLVKNAKFNRVRANGPVRELILDALDEDKINIIHQTIEYVSANKERLPNYFRELNREIQRGMHDLIKNGHIHERYRNVSLYSARHQFAANAKSANLPFREVAALLGHKSQKTASWHYARKTVGKGSIFIRPSEDTIARVSNKSPNIPTPQPFIINKSDTESKK